MRSSLSILIVLALSGCASMKSGWEDLQSKMNPKKESPAAAMVRQVESAHGKSAWDAKKALTADLSIDNDGSSPTQGTLTITPDCSKVRIDLAGGTRIVMDGEHAWISPSSADASNALLDLQTWPLFIAAPFRLSAAGVQITEGGVLPFGGRDLPILRMTLAKHPQDWFVLYPDPETGRLHGLVYAMAAKQSHESRALVYTDFLPVDGTTLASRWTFYHWSAADGITGDPVGRATLKNMQYVQPADDFFAKPEDARDLAMPTTTPATTEIATTEPATEPTTAPTSQP